jgi:cytidine deaminase
VRAGLQRATRSFIGLSFMEHAEIIQLAMAARLQAYAPYSKFAVGAALVTESGEIFTGCNVESVSFGLSMCAERVALGAAVTRGYRSFKMIGIVADSANPIVPCGACRQVLAEFSPALRVISANLEGASAIQELTLLLPEPRRGILEG